MKMSLLDAQIVEELENNKIIEDNFGIFRVVRFYHNSFLVSE
ncbi:conserved hypothetical protein [Clostridium neonatale]|uniref:Uncharacterized protein n=1 Tax=Clostridium neonatale TaxID=137838 RepID=A0AA86JH14_9CLOT|nr:hypothetical protein CNEO_42416 [Clostridium neonatale]CAI3196783.1 conserved hypothetical protein [Clostridium neonatale]CAI3200876.1 conserved hypothetical protein [Clostridium neonatale]CAI3245291.1 conserved hypothetical protein [Clostridium neonatale]CAI3246148.1 conserved hypothetical protein [Clostridium neonatale]